MSENIFMNSTFKILAFLYDGRDAYGITRTTQTEIGQVLGLSRMSVNKKIKLLKEHGYVIKKYKNSCEYELTDAGLKAVKYIRRVY